MVAHFYNPVVEMPGGHAPITAPVPLLVGGMMQVSIRDTAWDDWTEVVPGFLVLLGYDVLERSRL